jgi:hypothetical protein
MCSQPGFAGPAPADAAEQKEEIIAVGAVLMKS